MGSPFGFESNKTNAEDKRNALTDQAQLAQGRSNLVNAPAVTGGKNNQVAGLNLGGAKLQVAKGGTLNVTMGGGEEISQLSNNVLAAVDNISKSSNEALQAAFEESAKQQKEALAQVAALSESQQTGGDSGRNNIILWIVLGVLGLVGAIFYYRR